MIDWLEVPIEERQEVINLLRDRLESASDDARPYSDANQRWKEVLQAAITRLES